MQEDSSLQMIFLNAKPQPPQNSSNTTLDKIARTSLLRPSTRKTDKSSIAFLSSLIQTQVITHQQPTVSKKTHHSQRKPQPDSTLITVPVNPKRNYNKQTQAQILADKFFSQKMAKISTKQRGINNLLEPKLDSSRKKYAQTMQETIRKARTCKVMPLSRGHDESLIKIQNRKRMKRQFDEYVKIRQKTANIAQINRQSQKFKRQNHFTHSISKTIDRPEDTGINLYHFLKESLNKRRRQTTCKSNQTAEQIINKRITARALMDELGPAMLTEFAWTKLDTKSPFKLKTQAE